MNFRNKENSSTPKYSVDGLYLTSEVPAMQKVAEQCGVTVEIAGYPGQLYPTKDYGFLAVPEGFLYIVISGKNDLSEFWKATREAQQTSEPG